MAVNKALLILFLFKAVVGGEVDIMNPRRRCVPTTMQLGNCYVCMCKTDGVFHCRALKCDIYKNAVKTRVLSQPAKPASPGGTDFHSLPEIRDGEPCFPDQLYKMDCNTCRCTKDQALMCTKMACFDWKNLKHKEGKKALRDEENSEKKPYLPMVEKGASCKPGKIYRSKCKRCFCTVDNKLLCSKKPKDACTFDKYGNPPPIVKPEDIHPNIKESDVVHASTLSSASEQCNAGKYYKVDCNTCLCLDSGNLLCQKKLCLSYDDMNRLDAKEMSGKPCNKDEHIMTQHCKTCKCVEGKTQCTAVLDCTDKPSIQQLSGTADAPDQLDPDTDKFKCLPHTIYKTDCNKCYCQEDGSLRCTQKTCLNFSQVKLLEEQREFLERHGL